MNCVSRPLWLAGIVLATAGCPGHTPVTEMPPGTSLVLRLAILTHATTSLSAGEAAQIASDAMSVLANGTATPTDVPCPVQFTVASLGPFNIGNGVVNTGADYDALFSSTFPTVSEPSGAPFTRQVRVVSEIYWCGALTTSLAGCSDQQDHVRMVVVRRGSDREGILWAHEAGHTRGLQDRDDSLLALMYPTILPAHDQLNTSECAVYRQ